MRKAISFIFVCVLALFVSACSVSAPGVYPTNVSVNKNEVKIGQSTCRYILGFQVQKCSADEAIKNGNISQVQILDKEMSSFLIFHSMTISARGK